MTEPRGRLIQSVYGIKLYGSTRSSLLRERTIAGRTTALFRNWWLEPIVINKLNINLSDSLFPTDEEIAEAVWTYSGLEGRTLTE